VTLVIDAFEDAKGGGQVPSPMLVTGYPPSTLGIITVPPDPVYVRMVALLAAILYEYVQAPSTAPKAVSKVEASRRTGRITLRICAIKHLPS
jgi:hypothetical protein